jgi:hypothetical protein
MPTEIITIQMAIGKSTVTLSLVISLCSLNFQGAGTFPAPVWPPTKSEWAEAKRLSVGAFFFCNGPDFTLMEMVLNLAVITIMLGVCASQHDRYSGRAGHRAPQPRGVRPNASAVITLRGRFPDIEGWEQAGLGGRRNSTSQLGELVEAEEK